MKKTAIAIGVVLLLVGTNAAFAARGGEKGADKEAYEHASEEAIFHRIGDWFATIGKSKEEKTRILEERRAERARKRAQKEEERAKGKAEKEAKGAKGDKNLEKGLGKGIGQGKGKGRGRGQGGG
jgi:Mg-chelatase subunit ChlI